MQTGMSIPETRPFQVISALDMVFSDKDKIILVRNTGEGKICIIMTSEMICLGFNLVIVPCVGIGAGLFTKE